jgi:hypothetical protein
MHTNYNDNKLETNKMFDLEVYHQRDNNIDKSKLNQSVYSKHWISSIL